MLGYRHAYHAGNFADVFKHAVLLALLRALGAKDKPFGVLDTHAGLGHYRLDSPEARKTGEWREGIQRLWDADPPPPALADYLARVRAYNPDGHLRVYPGSPRLIRALLRPDDRLLACELNPVDHRVLKAGFARDRQVAVHGRDGYEALKALLPLPQRRGLVFIDPAHEGRGEYARLLDGLGVIRKRFPQGVTAIWYPLLRGDRRREFFRALQDAAIPAILCAELQLYPDDSPVGMNGCGMLIVNPPWGLSEGVAGLLQALAPVLGRGGPAGTRLEWLTEAG